MSDPVQIALIAAVTALIGGLPATIAALAAFRQGKDNGRKADEAAHQLATASAEVQTKIGAGDVKVAELTKKTDEIHVLANSNLAKVTAALELANEKITGLEKQISLLVESKIAALTTARSLPLDPSLGKK